MASMNKKPWPIVILAILYFLAPFYNLLYFSNLFNLSPMQYLHTLPSTLAVIQFFLFFPLAGVAIFAVKKWSFPIFLMVTLWNFYRNYQSWSYSSGGFTLPLYIAAEIINISVVAYFLIPAVRAVYFDPKLRWWEIAPRYRIDIPCIIQNNDTLPGTIKNIALGGVFLLPEENVTFSINDKIEFHFSYEGLELILQGEIVHFDPNYLEGYGIKFINFNKSRRHQIKKLIRRLDHNGVPKRLPLRTVEENVFLWFKQLLSTGKGLIPQVPEQLLKRTSKK